MSDATGNPDNSDNGLGSNSLSALGENSELNATDAPISLVEVSPGIAVAFGEVPEALKLGDIGILPSFDHAAIANSLGALGNAASVGGNLAQTAANVKGLYRLSDASFQLLKNGGQLASKDGANLGAIFNNGKIVAQARLVPVSMAAPALAAIGPAIAMMALQMQLNEVSGLMRANLAIATDTLKAIRRDQWTELEGLAESIDEAMAEARDLDSITESIWDPIAGSGPAIRKQLKLYRANVSAHIDGLTSRDGSERRQFLETHAEAIAFDTQALLTSVKAYGQYQALRAALARVRSVDDPGEGQLFHRITRTTPGELETAIGDSGKLIDELTRELRIIAELPGRAGAPLTKRRRDYRSARVTCTQLLDAIEPLANSLRTAQESVELPEITCLPDELDTDRYLHVLRWHLEYGESLRALAVGYESSPRSVAAAIPAVLGKRVDSAWDSLNEKKLASKFDQAIAPTLIAVTDRRIVTASPRTLLNHGTVRNSVPLSEVQFVRPASKQTSSVRPTIDVITDGENVRWMFPSMADGEHIEGLAVTVENGASEARTVRDFDNAALTGTGNESLE